MTFLGEIFCFDISSGPCSPFVAPSNEKVSWVCLPGYRPVNVHPKGATQTSNEAYPSQIGSVLKIPSSARTCKAPFTVVVLG